MANIFVIQQDLQEVFDTLEENGGELTPELEEKLTISQEEFTNKIKSYTEVIKSIDNDLDAIKTEQCRLKEYKEKKEKTKARLTKIVIEALNNFGDISKTGTKFVDFGTGKVSIRSSKAVSVNEPKLAICGAGVVDFVKWLRDNNQLDTIDSMSINDINSAITNYFEILKNNDELDGDFAPITTEDSENIDAVFSIKVSLNDFGSYDKFKLIKEIIKNQIYSVDYKANKTNIKDTIKNGGLVTIGGIITNESITIK